MHMLLLAKWLFRLFFFSFCHIEPATKYLHFVNSFRLFSCLFYSLCEFAKESNKKYRKFSFQTQRITTVWKFGCSPFSYDIQWDWGFHLFNLFYAMSLYTSINCVFVCACHLFFFIQRSSIKKKRKRIPIECYTTKWYAMFFNWLVLESKWKKMRQRLGFIERARKNHAK